MSTTAEHGISSKFTLADAQCMQIVGEVVADYWEEIGPILQKWVDTSDGSMNVLDIFDLTRRGLMQLFCMHTGGDIRLVAMTEFIQYPQYKVLRVIGLAGEKPLIAFKFMPAFEQWAQVNGAIYLETFATPRTVKLDQRLGFKPMYTQMRKALGTH